MSDVLLREDFSIGERVGQTSAHVGLPLKLLGTARGALADVTADVRRRDRRSKKAWLGLGLRTRRTLTPQMTPAMPDDRHRRHGGMTPKGATT